MNNQCEHCGSEMLPIKMAVLWCPSCGCVAAMQGTFGRVFSAQPAIVSSCAAVLDLTSPKAEWEYMEQKGMDGLMAGDPSAGGWEQYKPELVVDVSHLGGTATFHTRYWRRRIAPEASEKETAIRKLLLRYRGLTPPAETGGEDLGTVAPPTDGLS